MASRDPLLQRGLNLEYITLAWNVVGVGILAFAAIRAKSVALAGFGLDSFVEIFASLVVVWELKNINAGGQRRALRFIGIAFLILATYIAIQSIGVLITGARPHHSALGVIWTAITFLAMLALAHGKAKTGRALNNLVLQTEGRVTLIDAYLAAAVLLGLTLNALLGWWWADPLAGLVIVFYGYKEAWAALRHE
jgi:divalent metal cation (Fe/Co/Zn/Cd) transporter